MTAITDNGFARITKESLVRNPSTSGSISGDSIAYDPLTTINEKINSLTVSGGSQALIQFKDEGVNLGTIGTAQVVDFTGSGLTASRVGNVVTVNSTAAGDMVLASAQTNSGVKTFLDLTIGLRNVLNTFTSFFTNSNTASRTYTLPNVSGTVALTSDITGTNSGTNTGDETTGRINALYGTTNAITVGSVELGHATDTTLSRSAAGVLAIEGVVVPTISSTSTLTNKTLTTPAIASIKGTVQTDTDGATITFDKNVSDYHRVVLGGNRTLALSNMAAGDKIVIDLVQDGTGTRTVTWFTTIKWVGGTVPTLTTTINKIDTFGFICTTAGNYQGYIIGQNL